MISYFGEDRGSSFLTRLQNEDVIIGQAWLRPWLGWGNIGFAPADHPGNFAFDSAWAVLFGMEGLAGMVAFYGLTLGIPVYAALRGKRYRLNAGNQEAITCILVCLIAAAAYSTVAAYSFPILFVMLGALVSVLVQGAAARPLFRKQPVIAGRTGVGPSR